MWGNQVRWASGWWTTARRSTSCKRCAKGPQPAAGAQFLSDEVGALEGLPLRDAVGLFAQLDALHQEDHVPGQGAHALKALCVLRGLAGLPAVDAVPVLAGGDGHAGDAEELVQLAVGSGEPAPAGGGHGGSHLHGLVEVGAVKEPGQKSHQGGVGRGVVHRGAHYQAVTGLELGGGLVYQVVKNAFASLHALVAADTAPDVLLAHVDGLHLDALLDKNLLHLVKGDGGVSVGLGAAVDH